ncbi:MAG TPA: lysophospholipid acyltransferase family protein [Candidatus Omnitrophota bacterium]|nr:lysophospholipid acyltransferase family protein [Candidatus Omnitrophota bacterium]HPT07568.1 lysophospholipid acyltransferase family protein [Candidatus Omnitrophota bacterium]
MVNYFLYRLGRWIVLRVPLKLGYLIAHVVSDINFLFARADRAAVMGNLRVIFPDKSRRELRRIRRDMVHNFAKYLVDFFRFSSIDKTYVEKNIKLENLHYFDDALKEGTGVIVLTAHLGNWELGGVVLALLGYPFWAVALPHKDKRVNDFFDSQRLSKGLRVLPLGRAVRQIIHLIRENNMVALVGDRDFTQKGPVSEFFGKPSIFPEGPAALSLSLHTPIIPGFLIRNPDDTFTLRIEKPIEFSPTGDKEKDSAALIRTYTAVFERYIRQFPDQWYMFRRFWV